MSRADDIAYFEGQNELLFAPLKLKICQPIEIEMEEYLAHCIRSMDLVIAGNPNLEVVEGAKHQREAYKIALDHLQKELKRCSVKERWV